MNAPPLSARNLALAALAVLIAAGADAASIYEVTDFGRGASRLRLNNPGQVTGLRPSADGHSSEGFLYTAGQYTPLARGVQPISLADDGRVIDARGPYSYNPGISYGNQVHVNPAAAGNHLGTLVGSTYTYPERESQPYYNPYVYYPSPEGHARNTEAATSWGSIVEDEYRTRGTVDWDKYIAPDDPTGRGSMGATNLTAVAPAGINDSGQIIGNFSSHSKMNFNFVPGYQPPPYDMHAFISDATELFLKQKSGTVTYEHDLGTLGGLNSTATAINNAGQVTGESSTVGGSSHAFLYTGGKMVDLGLLPGSDFSRGLGLNEKGDVVGTSGIRAGTHWDDDAQFVGGHAFLYHDGIMEDLNDRLPATSGLTLDEAVAINEDGQILAYGHGADNHEHGVLLSPLPTPEPTALALLGLAALGLGARRLRRAAAFGGEPSRA